MSTTLIQETIDEMINRELPYVFSAIRLACAKRGLMGQYTPGVARYDGTNPLYRALVEAEAELDKALNGE